MNEMEGAVRIEQDEVIQSFLELISPVKGSRMDPYPIDGASYGRQQTAD